MVKGRHWLTLALVALMLLGMTTLGSAADAPKKMTLKLQTHLIPSDSDRVLGKFVTTVGELTDGQITIKLFPTNSIVPMGEVLDSVGSGAIEMAMIAEGYWHKLIPVSELAGGLPFAFRDISEAQHFMFDKGFGDLLKDGYAKHNVYHIPYEAYPVGLMTKNPVKKVEDLKGMKLRAYGVMSEWLTKLGATTTYIPGGELYTALATGVVDGAHWGDAGPMYVMKFHEVLKNYMKPEPIVGSWNNLIINMDIWKSLTPLQQKAIETAAMACGDFRSTENTRVLAQTSLNKMETEWGVKVNTLGPADIAAMTEAAKLVWEETAKKDPVNAKAVGMMKDFLRELGYLK